MNRTATPRRTWRFPRLIVEDHIVLALMIWAGTLITAFGVAITIDYFWEVTTSAWDFATTTATWYVAVIGGYVLYQAFPMQVAHGRTRRDSAIEMAIFLVVFSAAGALLVTIGYLIEFGVYGLAGWPREVSGNHLFSSHTDVALILTEYALRFLVWASAGALVGAAFYRHDAYGWLALAPAGLLVSMAGINTGPQFMGFIMNRLPSFDTASVFLFTVSSIACFLVALGITWPILRNVPIRNR